jgi:hypothetical protein
MPLRISLPHPPDHRSDGIEVLIFSFLNNLRRSAWVRATWPGSPVGKKGPRKANQVYKRRLREPWSPANVSKLRQMAKGNAPTGVMSIKLQRSVAAIRSKAQREGTSLKPINRPALQPAQEDGPSCFTAGPHREPRSRPVRAIIVRPVAFAWHPVVALQPPNLPSMEDASYFRTPNPSLSRWGSSLLLNARGPVVSL